MIEVRDLVRVLDKTTILDGLNFDAPVGEVTAFVGPNGAGKTTTMRVLSTLLRPTSGTVSIAGFDVVTEAHDVRRSIGLVTEEPSLFERLTPREHLVFTARAHGFHRERAESRADDVIELLGLGEHADKRSNKLSKGNRQKVAVGRAIVHDPKVLLLDEPMANLDVIARAAIEELITSDDLRAGRTVLLSTHALDEATRLCTRVVGIAKGRTIAEGTPDELIERTGTADFRSAFLAVVTEATAEELV